MSPQVIHEGVVDLVHLAHHGHLPALALGVEAGAPAALEEGSGPVTLEVQGVEQKDVCCWVYVAWKGKL